MHARIEQNFIFLKNCIWFNIFSLDFNTYSDQGGPMGPYHSFAHILLLWYRVKFFDQCYL